MPARSNHPCCRRDEGGTVSRPSVERPRAALGAECLDVAELCRLLNKGASNRTASANSEGFQFSMSASTISELRPSRSKFCCNVSNRSAERSMEVILAPRDASCADFPPGAAQRSRICLPPGLGIRRAGRAAAASCIHQSPSSNLGNCRTSRGAWSRIEPVGNVWPPSVSEMRHFRLGGNIYRRFAAMRYSDR